MWTMARHEALDSAIFCVTHPGQALMAKTAQILVSLELETPPAGATWEVFPQLPVRKAA